MPTDSNRMVFLFGFVKIKLFFNQLDGVRGFYEKFRYLFTLAFR